MFFYGKTKQHFKTIACEHLDFALLTGKNVKASKERAISDSIFHTDHKPSFDDFETLDKTNKFKLLQRESFFPDIFGRDTFEQICQVNTFVIFCLIICNYMLFLLLM